MYWPFEYDYSIRFVKHLAKLHCPIRVSVLIKNSSSYQSITDTRYADFLYRIAVEKLKIPKKKSANIIKAKKYFKYMRLTYNGTYVYDDNFNKKEQ